MATRIDKDGTIIRDNPDNWNQPNRNSTPQYYIRPEPEYNYSDKSPFVFYIITLVLSALVSWLLSGLVSVLVFDPHQAKGWLSGVTAFINNISPYAIFLAGIGGCFWYNVKPKHANSFNTREIFLSVLSTFVACLIVGVALFLLSLVIKIIIVVIIVVIAITIFNT